MKIKQQKKSWFPDPKEKPYWKYHTRKTTAFLYRYKVDERKQWQESLL